MLFNSYTFLFLFLPITLGVVLGVSALGWRAGAKVCLLAASLVFYGWANPRYLVVLAALVVFNYVVCAALIRLSLDDAKLERRRLAWFVFGIVANVGALAYFKYTNFAVAVANDLFGAHITIARVILPLGLSFITFQKIALLIDVYSGGVREIPILDYCLFVTFFPQLIAGPIVHHRDIFPQLADKRALRFSFESIAAGLSFFSIGLFKKALLADSIAGFANRVFDGAAHGDVTSAGMAWLGAVAYTLQLYFDFSGYCDMAVGLGRMFGIQLPANFDSPFKATNIIDFWRRWHMTLTRFLTASIYNPLLLSITRKRVAKGKAVVRRDAMSLGTFVQLVVYPTMLTMTVAGIWHGAGFQFAIFGALHGAYLVINHAWRSFGPKQKTSPASAIAGQALTFVAVVVAFVFFRADSVHTATHMLADMLGVHGFQPRPSLTPIAGAVVLASIAFVLPNTNEIMATDQPITTWLKIKYRPSMLWGFCVVALAIAGILQLDSSTEFLYFNF